MAAGSRFTSLDALRGLIMIIMALDHVRDFFDASAMQFSPTNLARTTTALFFTRWITHFCAPVFCLSAGIGAYLWWQRGRSKSELSRFLLTRGLWLILLEITIFRLSFQFTLGPGQPLILLVLWSLGCSMVALAALVWIPLVPLAILSVATIALHNLLDGVRGGALWTILHQPGAFRAAPWTIVIGYPVLAWIAVMAAGFCFGRILLFEEVRRRRLMIAIGTAMTLAYPALRALTHYGDPSPWTSGLLSFLNTTKYPPSLDFLLMTLGPALLAFAWFDRLNLSPRNPLVIRLRRDREPGRAMRRYARSHW